GDLLIEVGGEGKVDALATKIRTALEEGRVVRTLVPKVTLELRDIEPTADVEDVLEGLTKAYDCSREELRVKALRPGFAGMMRAVADAPAKIVPDILKNDKVKIGRVSTRVRVLPESKRCYRCQAAGHSSRECRGPDVPLGRNTCRRCGVEGHWARDCKSSPKCPVCTSTGRDANHEMWSRACAPRGVGGLP
ncbi:ATP-dependent RNA helicase glh-4, partial [Habropoda laboriosa]